MVKLVNRAKMTVASGGAGDITLGAAVAGYQTFADAGVSDTNVLRYTIEDGDDWEIGTGVYTASGTTLVRTVTESSNSNTAITCSAEAVIFVTLAAEDFSGNAAPIWTTTPPSTLDLARDGSTAVTLAGVAIDEFPVRYSWDGYSGTSLYDADSLPPQLSSAPTFSGGTASLVGSSTESNAGTFNFRMRASDGVKTATAITIVKLGFGYDIAGASYDGDSSAFDYSATCDRVEAVHFSPDGTKLFLLNYQDDTIYQFTLSTGYDLTTASYDSVSFSVNSKEAYPLALTFNPAGTRMFVTGFGSNSVHQWNLTTGFSIASTNVTFSKSYSAGTVAPSGLAFNSDGSKLFIVDQGNGADHIEVHSLPTNYDLGSASQDSTIFSVYNQDQTPEAIEFSPNGEKLIMLGSATDKVYLYTLTSAYDLSTISYSGISFSVASEETAPSGLAFNSNGSKMFVVGTVSDKLHSYSC